MSKFRQNNIFSIRNSDGSGFLHPKKKSNIVSIISQKMEKGMIRSIRKYEINVKKNVKDRTKNQYVPRDHSGFTIRQNSLHKIGLNNFLTTNHPLEFRIWRV